MAQRQAFTCDGDCGEEVGTRAAPVIYVVVGTGDGKMDADVKLPPQLWAILEQAVPRKDYCAGCFAGAFGTELVTLEEFEAAKPTAASVERYTTAQ